MALCHVSSKCGDRLFTGQLSLAVCLLAFICFEDCAMFPPNYPSDATPHATTNAPKVAFVLLILFWLCVFFGVYKCSASDSAERRMDRAVPDSKPLVAPKVSG